MSGWIKLEKDLATDPRVLRMASALKRSCNGAPYHPVTVVVGALARLWIHADSHAREDDTLDMSTEELDDLLGVPGLCALMPEAWLVVVDEHTVELPGYQDHNGVEAKSRAVTAKRVERHRNRVKRNTVTNGNAAPLPDQTRPDQTKPVHERARKPATSAQQNPPTNLVPKPLDHSAICGTADEAALHESFEQCRKAYPERPGRNDWLAAEHHWRCRVDEGVPVADLLGGVQRYRAYCDNGGVSGPTFVLAPTKFFGDTGSKPWAANWLAPAPRAGAKESFDTIHARLVAAGGDEYDDDEAAHA